VNESGQWVKFSGRVWHFKATADGITITECAGPMQVPVRNIYIPAEIHLSICKCLKTAAKDVAHLKRRKSETSEKT
jgi:hypothetical protein